MKKAYRATIGRIIARYLWDRSGVTLATLLLLGEAIAACLAAVSLASEGFDWGRMAALLGAAVLVLYVPFAVWKGKMPFAVPTEYEKRRRYAQATLAPCSFRSPSPSTWACVNSSTTTLTSELRRVGRTRATR